MAPSPTTITLDVLRNDTDAEDNVLTISDVGQPVEGRATTNGQQVDYIAPATTRGWVSFLYTI
ncbi:MAG: hypothetical protein HC828_09355 [Blastochloris sp.]|nr:hypothetical protein [Blastochloris sp.]